MSRLRFQLKSSYEKCTNTKQVLAKFVLEKNIKTSNFNIYAKLSLQIITAISFRIYVHRVKCKVLIAASLLLHYRSVHFSPGGQTEGLAPEVPLVWHSCRPP